MREKLSLSFSDCVAEGRRVLVRLDPEAQAGCGAAGFPSAPVSPQVSFKNIFLVKRDKKSSLDVVNPDLSSPEGVQVLDQVLEDLHPAGFRLCFIT